MSHTAFIVAAYAVTALVLAGAVLAVLVDGARQRRRLAELEARGIRRRSDQRVASATATAARPAGPAAGEGRA